MVDFRARSALIHHRVVCLQQLGGESAPWHLVFIHAGTCHTRLKVYVGFRVKC